MAGDLILHVTQENFDAEVLKSSLPVLIDFWAVWCGPCKAIAPLVDQMAVEYNGKLKVCKLDVDKAGQIAATYGVRSIPTLLIFKGGKVVDQRVGALNRDKLKEFIAKYV